jgi:hypothetical protein
VVNATPSGAIHLEKIFGARCKGGWVGLEECGEDKITSRTGFRTPTVELVL